MREIEKRVMQVNASLPADNQIHEMTDEAWWEHICKRVGGYLALARLTECVTFDVADEYFFFDDCGWCLYSFSTIEALDELLHVEDIG